MLKSKSVLVLGLWLVFITLLGVGLPYLWQSGLYLLTGFYLIMRFLFFVVRRETLPGTRKNHDTFVDNSDVVNLSKQ